MAASVPNEDLIAFGAYLSFLPSLRPVINSFITHSFRHTSLLL